MPSIGEGSRFVALLPGALETLVNNIKSGFATAGHTHGTSGIEDGAVTADKLSADVLAAMGGGSEPDLYDVLFEDDAGAVGTIRLAKAVTGGSAEAYKRVVIYHWIDPDSSGLPRYGSTMIETVSPSVVGDRFIALCASMNVGSTFHQYYSTARLSGSRLVTVGEYHFAVNGSSGSVSATSASAADYKIHVTRIEGWKV